VTRVNVARFLHIGLLTKKETKKYEKNIYSDIKIIVFKSYNESYN